MSHRWAKRTRAGGPRATQPPVKGEPTRAAGERPSLADDGSACVFQRTCGNVVKAGRTKTNLIVRSITGAFVKRFGQRAMPLDKK